jgi:acyl carrier protein
MENLEQVIYDVVQNVALENSIETEQLMSHHKLVDGLGFSSLDLARIVAVLELKLEVDPFARLVPITSVRTVGDLYAAYAKCFEERDAVKESEPDSAPPRVESPQRRERRGNRAQQRRRRGEARRVLS